MLYHVLNFLPYFFKIYFIHYAITVVPFFSSLYSTLPCTPLPPTPLPSHLSSCPWVIHISSLASPFPTLFLTSPCLFSTYHLCFLHPVPFPPFCPAPADNPPFDLYFCESVAVIVVCLVRFSFLFFGGFFWFSC